MKKTNYDLQPVVPVPDGADACMAGWAAVAARLSAAIEQRTARRTLLVVECYPGTSETEILAELARRLKPALAVLAADALRPPADIEALVAPYLGGNDPVFGRLSDLGLAQFFDPGLVAGLRERIAQIRAGVVLVVGCGARLLTDDGILVYADLARWEAQGRFRRNETGNLGAANAAASAAAKYKRAFFVDWRVADRWKQPLIAHWDFVLDTHRAGEPRLAEGGAVRRGLRHTTTRPFRVVPFFDPAPWGGQWMKGVCGLDPAAPNYGWSFDCVPEENSLLLGFGAHIVELPALDLVLFEPRSLLGARVHARFGAEFPIRFDLLDTMGGGNLSLQVHPLVAYIRQHFGLSYTQDESYYLLDAAPGAEVFLGLRDGVDPAAVACDLTQAQAGGGAFPAEQHVARWPAKKHDHFLIPAGTIHCSGANSLVLEISATPYIFTFKLWDWARPGLDGRPRPVHLEHGLANLQWNRTASWVRSNLINAVTPAGEGEGWRAERTGLHDSQFIESVRHWFTGPVPHHTRDGVQVLNLIEGEEAVVESPTGAFAPFAVHFAETFIVPAAVGAYTIRPAGPSEGRRCATIRASVRESASATSGCPSSSNVHHPDS